MALISVLTLVCFLQLNVTSLRKELSGTEHISGSVTAVSMQSTFICEPTVFFFLFLFFPIPKSEKWGHRDDPVWMASEAKSFYKV